MTPREKARELVDEYYNLFSVTLENTICIYEAKHCALIAVDKLLSDCNVSSPFEDERIKYWKEVKQEIEKL